jgi:uncharacterized linocin/CFP29 family protein
VPALGARKLVDFDGPKGWKYSATNLGRTEEVADGPTTGTFVRQRQVLPLVELRTPFTIRREELAELDRGAIDTDFESLDDAAHTTAVAENTAVFHGLVSAGIKGIADASSHKTIPLGENNFFRYPEHIAKAIEMLLTSGIEGPYAVALSPEIYTGVVESNEKGGYPLIKHIGTSSARARSYGHQGSRCGGRQPEGRRLPLRVGPGPVGRHTGHDSDMVNLYIEELQLPGGDTGRPSP